MMTGYWISKAIYVAAKLGVADLLTEGPRNADELAAATQTQADALYRVLRALASVGIFSEVAPRRFALTPLAELLRSDTPDSMRALAIMYAEEQYRAWDNVLHSVQTGQPAFEHAFGARYFDYFATHPEASRVFNEAMVGWTNQVTTAVVAAYDFSPFGVVADVAGGHGALLAAILKSNPTARGILFDLPQVVAGAEPFLTAAGVADRCARVGGDFFAEMPQGADAYVLSQILHDWDDERSVAVLRQVRMVMPNHGKLLVVELVLPEGNDPFLGKWLDLHMLVLLGGQERTVAQYATLLREAGFELTGVVPTSAQQCIVEAFPV
jgi:O-methyltransferase domain/Dimerisation domain